MSDRQPSMHDVARAAGVHQTTVSRALRNDHHLPETTRERIKKIADEMGYRPHPLVSALVALRRTRHPPEYRATIGVIVRSHRITSGLRLHLEGVKSGAERQGYRVETFTLGSAGLTEKRLNSVLFARNIHGLVIAPLPEAHGNFELEWNRFCTVVIEYTFTEPAFDRVVHDSYGGMRKIMEECRRRGIRRIGLTLTSTGHERTERLNAAGYWVEQKSDKAFAAVPPLIMPEWDAARFAAWFRANELEAVITSNEFLPSIREWVGSKKLQPGRDVQLINVNTSPNSGVAGIFQDPFAIGSMSARLVIEKVTNNDRGIPPARRTILTPGVWVEGASLRTLPSERPVAAAS
jgi:LacI family transcriptional regulator/LacI family fructose operon transcriptional repressor